MEVDMDKIVI